MTSGGPHGPGLRRPPGPSRLILASRSPRRQEALRALGLRFETVISSAEETLGPLPDPTDPVPIALAKAAHIAAGHPAAVILAGDTLVELDGQALGKPADAPGANAMLGRLRGRAHAVRTAVAVVAGAEVATAEVVAPVLMRRFGADEVGHYVATGEPLDCAGAYDVHGAGGALVAAVEGCFGAVVGLPLIAAATLLEEAGVAIPCRPAETCSQLYGRPCLAAGGDTVGRCQPGRRATRPLPLASGGLSQ